MGPRDRFYEAGLPTLRKPLEWGLEERCSGVSEVRC